MNTPLIQPSVALGELVDILSGFAFKSERFSDAGELPIVRIRDVKRGHSSTFYSGEYEDRYLVNDGDLLIGMDGEFNRERWRGGKALLNQRVCKLSADIRHLSLEYLYYFLPKALKDIEDRTPFATVKHLSSKDIKNIQIPLPPLDEQRRIAAILDSADALRRKRERILDLLDDLTQSIFSEMFGDPVSNPRGWNVRKLGEVADFYSGNSLPAGEEFTGQSNGYLLLKVSDLNRGGNEEIIGASSEWSPSPGAKAGTCDINAVIFPKRGGAIATNKKRKLFRPAILDPNLMAVAPTNGHVTLDYLFAWFQKFRLEDIASGSSVPQLNKQDLAPLEICIPPLDLQGRFTEVRQRIISQRVVAATSNANSEILFSSIQSRAFSGQL